MAERGILDIMINHLPVSAKDKAALCMSLSTEDELTTKSVNDIEQLLEHSVKHYIIEEISEKASREAECARRLGIQWVSCAEAGYPPLLREIYAPPAVLYYRGTLPNPAQPLAAMVGTRKPSAAASEWAYRVGAEFGKAGHTISIPSIKNLPALSEIFRKAEVLFSTVSPEITPRLIIVATPI
jgi:DNA processing protein